LVELGVQLGVLNCFPVVGTGEDVLFGKPDAAIYRLACSRVQIDPRHLLAIEDAVSGIRAAVGAGLSCLGIASHEARETLVAAGAAHVVPDFESVSVLELEGVLLRRSAGSQHAAAAGSI
jgi:beta-phosphoglucomutase-like phosphatase (HAD superfamily)